ncbi:MAG: hypothetical protein GWN99_19810 [Gemmatimonadetes bacterium]|uniref:DUF7482 domain-containing protein n=1 Tax=Candidatus Kutchimonas denitrificans TaxID=3056748 RepID=A0AAE4ZBY2_9BACT|nr:hypothetical protein [Gemmatimonadota bacterium]NIR76452.1 hypothetical protein [Candidatus Kutchimonas denitrificans]NIS03270.1 hypothetical protein [Gemmatimonadota bacterium]NIT69131.1 hypothetical protein [Gemmatimonadota bacterium]NIU54523.1 hypothetical protein [Gemmatimonadota bacterium]
MKRAVLAGMMAGSLVAVGCEGWNRILEMGVEGAPEVPPVRGYASGEEILFVHTEASDSAIARILTEMMRSPVFVVPELARAEDAMLAEVYVFTNGLQPAVQGPLGYQPDVFDCPPEQACYRPLRRVSLVTWVNPGEARLLRSASEVEAAIEAGELTMERPGVVVNMPMIRWPGGER